MAPAPLGAIDIPDVDRYGVIGYARIFTHAGTTVLASEDVSDSAALARLCIAHGLRRLFISREGTTWLPIGDLKKVETIRLRNVPRKFAVMTPSLDPASPWYECKTAPDLWAALEVFRTFVGISWRLGAGQTAEALIASTHPPSRGGTILKKAPDPPPPARIGNTEAAFTWCRPLTKEEREGQYVYGFDMNAQYLAAWSSLSCGLGGIQHRTYRPDGEPLPPGYYRATFRGDAQPDPCLPPIATGQWHHSETIALALELGELAAIHEAYIYTEHSRFLTGAYNRLRDARAELVKAEPPASYAREAVKRLYQIAYGRFGAGYRFEKPDRWLRPDWRHGTIARARANLYRRLRKVAAAVGARPFAINVDAVYFAGGVESLGINECAEVLTLPLGDGLGQFHPIARAPLTKELHRPRSARQVAKHVHEEGTP